MKHHCLSFFYTSALLFSFLYNTTALGVELKKYPHHMHYWPAVDSIYSTDSIYFDSIGEYRYFDIDTYYRRFAELGDKAAADDSYYYLYEILMRLPKEEAFKALDDMENKAESYQDSQLAHRAEYMRVILLNQEPGISTEQIIKNMQVVIDKATARGDTLTKLRSMTTLLGNLWFNPSPDYPQIFRQILLLRNELEDVTEEEFIDKRFAYFVMGNAYAHFHDYDKAIPLLKKALRENSNYFFDRSNLRALNALADVYRTLEMPDSTLYFSNAILKSKDMVLLRPKYDLIAIANIGLCHLDKKEYDRAVDYLETALKGAAEEEDYSLATEINIGLADAYLGQKEIDKASQRIDEAKSYIQTYKLENLYRLLYRLESRYYGMKKDTDKSLAYLDSTLKANKKYLDKFNALTILRAEQELFEAEKTAREVRFNKQRQTLIFSLMIIGITLGMLILLFWAYRRKRKAYEGLNNKMGEWTNNEEAD